MFEIINNYNNGIKELDVLNNYIKFVIKEEKLENCVFNIIIKVWKAEESVGQGQRLGCKAGMAKASRRVNTYVMAYIGLAQNFIQVFLYDVTEKPKRTFWPTQ